MVKFEVFYIIFCLVFYGVYFFGIITAILIYLIAAIDSVLNVKSKATSKKEIIFKPINFTKPDI